MVWADAVKPALDTASIICSYQKLKW